MVQSQISSQSSEEKIDIHRARVDLDADHYALDSVKRRVLEFLAVRKFNLIIPNSAQMMNT